MASKAAVLGDPRRPQEIKMYRRPPANDDALSPAVLMAMMMGMASLMLRQKVFGWLAILLSMVAVTHANTDSDYKQIVMGLTFSGVGLMQSYLGPAVVRPTPAAAPAEGP